MITVTSNDSFDIDRGTVYVFNLSQLHEQGRLLKMDSVRINGVVYQAIDIEIPRGWPGAPERVAVLVKKVPASEPSKCETPSATMIP